QKIFSEKDFHPATFETHNAFYLIWALAEPPGTDILSNEVIARYRVPNLPNQWNQRVEGRQTGKGWPQKKYRRYHNMFR
ncbi:MAG: hypothetical protein GY757_16785, partial [bacterium]|nr:hypothetical protein [bacterium]